MVDLDELRAFATELPDGADTLVREAIAELTALRAKAAAADKLADSVRHWSSLKVTRDYHPLEQALDLYDAYTKAVKP